MQRDSLQTMRFRHRFLLLSAALCAWASCPARAGAAEPFLKPNDVIALIGGEDMVAASENGNFEFFLTRALPGHKLRFRCLAWEGDTVFEQRRDLNYPTLEEQLDKIGATVVIARFGQMESLAGKEKLSEFIAAYEKLIERVSDGSATAAALAAPSADAIPPQATSTPSQPPPPRNGVSPAGAFQKGVSERGGKGLSGGPESSGVPPVSARLNEVGERAAKRRVIIIEPTPFDVNFGLGPVDLDRASRLNESHNAFLIALRKVAAERRLLFCIGESIHQGLLAGASFSRDGVHLSAEGHGNIALDLALKISNRVASDLSFPSGADIVRLRNRIIAKNWLWFQYSRPQNWAFLAGDRTNQPSSRDHLDPSKRWFPTELEEFMPLIEAKEREIDALAAELAKP